MKRTADSIEQLNAEKDSAETPKFKRGKHPNSLANLVAPWNSETHPRGGRPKDTAADIARKAFEKNQEHIYTAYTKALLQGSPYAFDVLANRAYGKMKETKEVHLFDGVTDSDIDSQIADILRKLGIAEEIEAIEGRAEVASDRS